jgi:hypothetical protein
MCTYYLVCETVIGVCPVKLRALFEDVGNGDSSCCWVQFGEIRKKKTTHQDGDKMIIGG